MTAEKRKAVSCLLQLISEAYKEEYANEQYRDVKAEIPEMFQKLCKKNPLVRQHETDI